MGQSNFSTVGKDRQLCSLYVENFFHSMDSKPFVTGCLKINSPLPLNRNGAVLAPGVKRPGIKPNTQFQLLPRLRMSGAMPVLPLRFNGVEKEDLTCNFVRQSMLSFIYTVIQCVPKVAVHLQKVL
jgi:hypothetical protein